MSYPARAEGLVNSIYLSIYIYIYIYICTKKEKETLTEAEINNWPGQYPVDLFVLNGPPTDLYARSFPSVNIYECIEDLLLLSVCFLVHFSWVYESADHEMQILARQSQAEVKSVEVMWGVDGGCGGGIFLW